jgi:lipopolysaccharide transport system permease protein
MIMLFACLVGKTMVMGATFVANILVLKKNSATACHRHMNQPASAPPSPQHQKLASSRMRLKIFLHLLYYKSAANLRTEISRYYLNYLWWVIDPVLTMAVFYVVFDIFLNRGTANYVAFLLTGLTWWNWFARSVQNASTSIYQGRRLMLQVNITKLFFPLEVCLRDSFKQLFVSILLLVFLYFCTPLAGITWLALPVLVAVQGLLILGVATFCSAIVPFVPDLKFIISTGIHLLFFASGIFFKIEDVVLTKHQFILYLNPMAGMLKNYREILIYGHWPDWFYLGKVALLGAGLCLVSFLLIHKMDKIYPRICNR